MSKSAETARSSVTANRELPLDYSGGRKQETLGPVAERSCLFTYHEIIPADSRYLYRVTSSTFENHLSFISSVRKNPSATAVPQISFDDGHCSNYENAFPMLERFGLKATFFVLAGRIGTPGAYISWGQAREMASAGHRIESHGWSHRILTQCSSLELDQELSDSKREIEDRLGVEVDSISAPGGRWNERVVDACVRAGYNCLFHSNPWAPVSLRKEIRVQGRQMVTGQMDALQLQKLMRIGRIERNYLRARYAAKERARLVLGEQLYHKLWCWIANWNPEEGVEVEITGRANAGGKLKSL